MPYKLPIAILVSVLVHILLIANLKFPINTDLSKQDVDIELREPNLGAIVLQVGFLNLASPERELVTTGYVNTLEYSKKSGDINTLPNNRHIVRKESSKIDIGLSTMSMTQNAPFSGNKNLQVQYLKSNNVDIRAIPVHGIELPTPTGSSKLLLVYQLRVFINKNGNVEQVVNLDKNNTKQLFYAEIEAQVKKLIFIPAKKNGVEVNSYIDIALEA